MSVGYAPIVWTSQKRKYDKVIVVLILVYLILFCGLQLIFFPNTSIETLIIRATGTLAFLMLHIVLSIGPLSRLNEKFRPLLYNRRHLGVSLFLIALVHGIFNIIQFHSLGNSDPILSIFASNLHYQSIGSFPFQILGFIALLILFIMAATSHDFWLKNLGPRTWKVLHMLVYVAYFLLVFHVILGIGQMQFSWIWIGLVSSGFLMLTTLHIASSRKRKQLEYLLTKQSEEYFEACSIDEIQENRAKIFTYGEEEIAIFKYDNKISAVHNLCKHQHGPLGEGKIVDGCITCPWHGYQYHPHNGQSPPPFTEKIKTYNIKVINNRVWVDPRGLPEGSEVSPIRINSKD